MKNRKTIDIMRPYVPGKPIEEVKREYNLEHVIKLASNENPYGCSKSAKDSIVEALDELQLYPDGNATALRQMLGKFHDVQPSQLIFGAGSDEIITMLAQVYINPGDEAITCTPSFPRYDAALQLMDGHLIKCPLKNHTFNLNEILTQIKDHTKLIFISNPNNPTGTYIPEHELIEFLDQVPKHVLVILDEAYYEYATGDDFPESVPLLKKYHNLIVLRTFSKAYGLASLRVGYGIASEEIIGYLNRVRGPFNVTTLGQRAATKALEDQEFVKYCVENNQKVKEFSFSQCEKLQLNYIDTKTNFMMIDTKLDSNKVFVSLQKKGFIVRPGFFFDMPTYIRLSFGTHNEMIAFFKALEDTLLEVKNDDVQ